MNEFYEQILALAVAFLMFARLVGVVLSHTVELFYPFKSQYLHKNSSNWCPFISLKNELGEFDKRSRHFLFGDQFINSHNLISWQCMDIVGRNLMLVTIGASRVKGGILTQFPAQYRNSQWKERSTNQSHNAFRHNCSNVTSIHSHSYSSS